MPESAFDNFYIKFELKVKGVSDLLILSQLTAISLAPQVCFRHFTLTDEIFCSECKAISRRADRRLIVLRPKLNIEKVSVTDNSLPLGAHKCCSSVKGLKVTRGFNFR